MTLFRTLTSPIIPLFRDHLDTDFIAPHNGDRPSQAFARMRIDPGGRLIPESLFERPPFSQAAILLVGREFGFGSRTVEAVGALKRLGLACVLGLSFSPAFVERALHEGLVSLIVGEGAALQLAEEAMSGDAFTIDLAAMALTTGYGDRHVLTPPSAVRAALASAWNERAEPKGRDIDDDGHLIFAVRA